MCEAEIVAQVEREIDTTTLWDIKLVPSDDVVYKTLCRKFYIKRQKTNNSWNERNTGEVVGYKVEEAVRHWVAEKFTLCNNRIIMWRDTAQRNLSSAQELDIVVKQRGDKLILFEVKVVGKNAAKSRNGFAQLLKAEKRLLAGGLCKQVIKRLIYVTEEVEHAWMPIVDLKDKKSDFGLILLNNVVVEQIASKYDIPLLDGWHLPDVRREPLYLAESATQYVQQDPQFSNRPESSMALAFRNAMRGGRNFNHLK